MAKYVEPVCPVHAGMVQSVVFVELQAAVLVIV